MRMAGNKETGLMHKSILSRLAMLALCMLLSGVAKPALAGTYVDKGMVVIDLENGIEWLKFNYFNFCHKLGLKS